MSEINLNELRRQTEDEGVAWFPKHVVVALLDRLELAESGLTDREKAMLELVDSCREMMGSGLDNLHLMGVDPALVGRFFRVLRAINALDAGEKPPRDAAVYLAPDWHRRKAVFQALLDRLEKYEQAIAWFAKFSDQGMIPAIPAEHLGAVTAADAAAWSAARAAKREETDV